MLNPTAPSFAPRPHDLAGKFAEAPENQEIPGSFEALLAQETDSGPVSGGSAASVEEQLPRLGPEPESGNPDGRNLPDPFLPDAFLPLGLADMSVTTADTPTPRDKTRDSYETALPALAGLPLPAPAELPANEPPASARRPHPLPAHGEATPVGADVRMPAQAADTLPAIPPAMAAIAAVRPAAPAPRPALSPAPPPQPAEEPSFARTPLPTVAGPASGAPRDSLVLVTAARSSTVGMTAGVPAREATTPGPVPADPANGEPPRAQDAEPAPGVAARARLGDALAPVMPLRGQTDGGPLNPAKGIPAPSEPPSLLVTIDPAAPLAGEVQPVMVLREVSASGSAPVATALQPQTAAGERHDLVALAESIADALEAASPDTVRATVRHADFGQVSLRFRSDDGGLSVAMTSRDPDFVPTVQAAAGQSPPQSDAGSSPQRYDATGQQHGGAATGQPQSQAQQGSAQTRSPQRDHDPAFSGQAGAGHASSRENSRGDRPARSGIFA